MNRFVVLLAAAAIWIAAERPAGAQDDPPPIGGFVVDLHGVTPRFGDDPDLAASRGLQQSELPGSGLGIAAGAHAYLPKFHSITIGIGGELMIGRAPMPIFSGPPDPALGLRAVTETFTSLGPHVSLNFGNGNGWSYLSGGLGLTTWSIVAEGAAPLPVDDDRSRTFNYGGGARWFAKPRLAFSVDVRFYRTAAGVPQAGNPGQPAATLLVIGAGISVR